jgi:3-deoxy-D-manno-octulosonate 8-phosphate phosphatase (KDO 8-P phosphatase)
MKPELQHSFFSKASQTKLLITDVDGVLTDGKIWYGENGEIYKSFHIHDGHGLKMLMKFGIAVGVISGRANSIVERRLKELGIVHYYLGYENKLLPYQELIKKLNLQPPQVAYIGDDVIDIPVMKEVGLSVAVANAVDEVKQLADWQTQKMGGDGAVRELCDLIIKSQSK